MLLVAQVKLTADKHKFSTWILFPFSSLDGLQTDPAPISHAQVNMKQKGRAFFYLHLIPRPRPSTCLRRFSRSGRNEDRKAELLLINLVNSSGFQDWTSFIIFGWSIILLVYESHNLVHL